MKYIQKGVEPNSLKNYRSTPNATFDSCNKKDIRKALIREQGAICAYCMQRISFERNVELNKYFTEIEHYKSQDVYNGTNGNPDLRMSYNNMLGVCNGNSGQPLKKLHCDKSKDSNKNKQYLPLTIDPLKKNCEELVKFRGNGRIISNNNSVDNEINVVLNLNEQSLMKNRQIAINFAIKNIKSKRRNQDWRISDIQSELKVWQQLHKNGFHPYCQAVIYYLRDKIRKKS